MKFSSFRYLVKEGLKNVWHNRVMSFTSIGVLTTCLIIVGAAYLITVNVTSMVSFIENESEMVVIVADIDDTAVTQLEADIKSIANVKACTFVSKSQGLENAKAMLEGDGFLLDGFEDRNVIPAMFEIRVKDLELSRETAAQLASLNGVELVQASHEVADTLTYVQTTVNTFGFILIGALGVISLVIIANTIKATIFTRRKEINIMKYVGATNSFIRIPFVVEGFMLGLISSTLSFFIVWGSYHYLTSALTMGGSVWLQSAFESIIPFEQLAADVGIFFIGTGTLLGMIGSAISIRNHARV